MKIVFDVFVDGKVKETLQPSNQRLKEIHAYVKAESYGLIQKYGKNVYLNRRVVYN
ncbi:mechanosensitive ion channel protein MscL [Paenibacillus alkaliterrae]|uniref:mechanosensitive ion channel protein MscL n=1 Tax=Paenibacillus alkaliterrae TaxID=320909 RepID=UPI001F38C0F7|nr:mechanosensitive ion channel protein MscL [Paenibacillus alkaliterrae]MCF2937526.1 mechanosensitive ion channel protein MscL [Paenibacillus alkaliterrae]